MSGNEELLSGFEVNQTAANVELLGIFQSGQGSQELLGELISRQAASAELLGETVLRRSALIELSAEFVIRRDGIPFEIPGEFISRQSQFIIKP